VTLFCGGDHGPLAEMIDRTRVRVVVAPGGIARGRGSRRRLGKAAALHLARHPHDACFIPGNYHWPAIRPLSRMPVRIVAQISAAVVKVQRNGLRRRLYEWRMRGLLRHADAVVALSERAADEARVILPGLRVERIALPALEDDVASPLPASGRMVVAAGRLVPEKGFHDLIAAFALVEDREPTLTIVGAGPEAQRLRDQAASLGLRDRIKFPGYQTDIRPYLDEARLFVLSSHYEGYAAVLIEALAAGRPIVATDCTPATAELLDDPSIGQVVPIGDVPAMADAIGRMLAAAPPNPQALAAKVQGFKISPVAGDYIRLFAQLGAR
jgi:glycosyltransferase involved in cell wall biosynthesis